MTAGPEDDPLAVLVERVTSRSDDAGAVANDVLRELQRGHPVEGLGALLRHPDSEVVGVGTWLAAELGPAAAPLADQVPALLTHSSRDVRFYAVDVAMSTATDLAAHVVPLLDDPDVAVRWKATGFLSRASTPQLESALQAAAPTGAGAPELRWLLSPEARDPAVVRHRLAAADRRTRLFAVAAAARLLEVTDGPLRAALDAADDEVRRFAEDWLTVAHGGRES